jgi:DNA repair protein RadC
MKTTTAKQFEIRKIQTNFPNVKITGSDTAADFIRQFYGDDIEVFESSFILLLNNAHKTIGFAKISQGGITGTVIDVRLVAKYAVEAMATAVILAHNHPSGNLKYSQSDLAITEKVKNGLNILDINLIDHLILTAEGHYSFADNAKI